MSQPAAHDNRPAWRHDLPVLTGSSVLLREPAHQDVGPLIDLFAVSDASRFGLDEDAGDVSVLGFIERARADRARGVAFTYVVTLAGTRTVVGLFQVRALDVLFENAEWEATLVPSIRGTGVFLESARLVGSLTFGTVGARRLESRVAAQNGRANGALRKLGAVQEGVLRRSVRRHDQFVDQILWSILKEDWTSHWVSTGPRVH